MKIYALLPCVYSTFSNGITTLIYFYREFQDQVDAEFRFLVCTEDVQALQSYRLIFGAGLLVYTPESMEALRRAIASEPFALIRPDDLEGISNPIHWCLAAEPSLCFCLNILLAPPFVFAKSRSILEYYGPKDYFMIANQVIMPAFARHKDRDCYLESDIGPRPLAPHESTPSPNRISIYIGKGIATPVDGLECFLDSLNVKLDSSGITHISRTWPDGKDNLHKVLLGSIFLLSFDPFSHIEREASLLGIPVLKPVSLNLSELPGVFTDLQELIAIDLHVARPRISKLARHDYHQKRSKNQESIRKASLALTELLVDHRLESSKTSIPYSKRLLYAFGSQLRAYQPLLGQIHLCSIVNQMNSLDVAEILSGKCKSLNALEYKRVSGNYLSTCRWTVSTARNKSKQRKPVLYRYLQ
jgi:hypothetical protein